MKRLKLVIFAILVLLLVLQVSKMSFAVIDLSVPEKGHFLLRSTLQVHAASNWFDHTGMSVPFTEVSKLTHVDSQLEMYYSFTRSIMAGIKFPIDYARMGHISGGYFHGSAKKITMTEMLNPWLTLQHEFLTIPFSCAYSIGIKLPIIQIDPIGIEIVDSDNKTIEEFLYMDDKQVDIDSVVYIDWQSSRGIYIYGKIGYKYRMDSDVAKPGNELRSAIETGYTIVPGVRIFTCSDYTKFHAGEFGERPIKAGFLYSIKAGVKFLLGRNTRVEILTEAVPWGKNQFQWIGGRAGIAYVSGNY